MSTVDVIVPCYNYAHFLEECVESVLSQSHGDLRVLIINDASTDNTHEVAQELLRRDPRVQYLRHPVNRGHIATYNEGLEWATGEYTLLLSADDMLTPGSLARSVRLMDAHPDIVMTHGMGFVINQGEPIPHINDVDTCKFSLVQGRDFIKSFCVRGGNRVCTPTAVVRTNAQKRIGGYRADLPHSGDMEMWLRFGTQGDIGYIAAHQAYYRKHAANMHYTYLNARNMEEQRLAFSTLFDSNRGLIPNAGELRALATRRMAEEGVWSAYNAFERQQTEICGEFLDFAAATAPEITSWGAYRRMRWKLLLGARLWSGIRALQRHVAFIENDDASDPSPRTPGVGQPSV